MAQKPKKRKGESTESYLRRVAAWRKANGGGRGGTSGGKRGYRIYGYEAGRPLGVSQDYRTTVSETDYLGKGPKGRRGRERVTEREVGARYFSGAAAEIFGSMNPDDLLDVQTALWRLGWLKEKDITGAFSKQTESAVEQMLGGANAEGVGWKKWLGAKMGWLDANGIDSLGSAGSGESTRALQINLTNPDTIKAQVTQASTALLGGNYAGDPQHYVDEIHAAETKQQTDAYNQTGGPEGSMAPGGGGGGTTVDPPSVEALIMKEHPVDYGVEQSGRNAQAILEGLLRQHTADSRG